MTGVGWTPETDRGRYAYLDIPWSWTDEFPERYPRPVRAHHRHLGIRAERRTVRQWLRGFLPLFVR